MIYKEKENKFIRESWKEWISFLVKYEFYYKKLSIPKGYVFYGENLYNDDKYFCFFLFYPFFRIKYLLEKGFNIGKIRIYMYFPSKNVIKNWKTYREFQKGEQMEGAFLMKKWVPIDTISEDSYNFSLIYKIYFPPFMISSFKEKTI